MSARACVSTTLAVLAAFSVLPHPAVAAGEALTKVEIACQRATGKALGAYAKARVACVAKCEKKSPLAAECLEPFANGTLTCVQKARTKLAALLAKKCVSSGSEEDSCPECYEEVSGNCAALGAAATAKTVALTNGLTGGIFCDDSGSPDGLTKVEAKCQGALLKSLTGFVPTAVGCVGKCLANERKGKTDGTCNPQAFLSFGGDSRTLQCLQNPLVKIFVALQTKCQDAPECMSNALSLLDMLQVGLSDIGGAIMVCPAQCGDGYLQGLEECESPGTNSCPGNAGCSAQCTCVDSPL
jgi:hypothetical protein